MVKLSEIITVNPRLPKNIDDTQKVSFIAMASTSEEGLLLNEEFRILAETRKGFTYFAKGDVLLAKITPCFENGKCLRPNQITNQIGFGSTEFHVLRANPEKIDSAYLFYMIWSKKFRFLGEASMSGAAGQKRVSTDFLKEFKIPLPPLTEQKRIAAILDKADTIRRKRQQAIQLAEDFLRAVFLDMFGDPVTNPKGWEQFPIGKISVIQGGLQVTQKRAANPIEVPYLRVANVFRDRLDLKEIKTIQATQSELNRTLLKKGDILVVEGHGNPEEIGRTSVWDESIAPCTHQNHLIRVRVRHDNVDPVYLSAFLNSHGGRRQLLGFGKTTSGLNTISASNVKETNVLLPPLSAQKKYHAISQYLSDIINSHQRKISEEGDKLFNSLTQRAF